MTRIKTFHAENPGSSHGFALIAAIALLSFVFLLLVSLATLVRIETRSMGTTQTTSKAQENALTALSIAIGELQKYAGDDCRITARAEILPGTSDAARLWTGVWPTSVSAATDSLPYGEPHWLISSSGSPDPATPDISNSIPLLNYRTATGTPITIQGEVITLSNSGTSHDEAAWWIGDESLMAKSAPASDNHLFPSTYNDPSANKKDYDPRLAWMEQFETLFQSNTAVLPESITRAQSYHEGAMAGPDYEIPFQRSQADLSFISQGLLVDVMDGGFRKDLSRILESGFSDDAAYANNASLYSGGPSWGLLRSYYQLPFKNATLANEVPSIEVQAQTATQHGVAPILTAVQLNLGAMLTSGTEPSLPRWTLKPIVAIANPYNVALEPSDYTVEIQFNRALILFMWTQLAAGKSYKDDSNYDLQSTFANVFGAPLKLKMNAIGFRPGEVKVFSLANSAEYDSSGAELTNQYDTENYTWKDVSVSNGTIPQSDLDPVTSGAVNCYVRVRWGYLHFKLYQGNTIVQAIDDSLFSSLGAVTTQWNEADSAIPMKHQTRDSSRLAIPSPGQYPTRSDGTGGSRWLADYNPRAINSEQDPGGLWLGNPVFDGYHYPIYETAFPVDSPFGSGEFTHTFWGPDNTGSESFVTLFEVPTRPLYSLGQFQHLNLSEAWEPAYAVGNSYASPYVAHDAKDFSYRLNEVLWDDFFFSSRVDASGTVNAVDGNPRYTLATTATENKLDRYDTAATQMSVDGMFNVNSTSVEAWKAVLSGWAGERFDYVNPLALAPVRGSIADLELAFPRFSLPSGNDSDPWRGFRTIDGTPDAQLEALAKAIVDEVKARGPFLSVSDFVNRDLDAPGNSKQNLTGALQAAIDATSNKNDPLAPPGINDSLEDDLAPESMAQTGKAFPYPGAGDGPRSAAAPGFLTQADILTQIGPYLTARGDTFRIRAYGSVTDTISSQTTGKAWCEAIVQRQPEYVDDTADPAEKYPATNTNNQTFGRKFSIVSFRWLNEDEI